jgi:hypothetical protein
MSVRYFRALRYSSRDGHAEGELVNRGRDTSSFCPTLQVLDMLLSAVSVLVVAQPSSEVTEGLMNYPVFNFYTVLPQISRHVDCLRSRCFRVHGNSRSCDFH